MVGWLRGPGVSRRVIVAVAAVALAAGALGFLIWAVTSRSPARLAWLTSMATVLAVVLPAWGMSVAMLTWALRSGQSAASAPGAPSASTAGTDGLLQTPRLRPPAELEEARGRPVSLPEPRTAFIGYVPALPARYVARAGIFDAVCHDVLSYGTVSLVGMGGAGKTILATAIARDPNVQAAFPDGIAWVDAGPQATPTQLQERLAARLTGKTVSFPTAEEGRHRLAELLASRAFLLVIDDIWDAEALNALNVTGAPQGALLFTTRGRGIARAAGATEREVDQLTLDQALALLGHWTDTGFDQLPPIADRLCLRVGNLALGVALVGGMVKARGAQPRDWQDVMDLLESADIDAIRDEYGPDSYKHASVLASITLSIDDLPPAAQERYRELAVFAGRGSVPPNAVSAPLGADGLQCREHWTAAHPAHRSLPRPA
jgi:hypothetical protein